MIIWNRLSRTAFAVLERNSAVSYLLTHLWQKKHRGAPHQVDLIRHAVDMLQKAKVKAVFLVLAWVLYILVSVEEAKGLVLLLCAYITFTTSRSFLRYLYAAYQARVFLNDYNVLLHYFEKRSGELHLPETKFREMADRSLMHWARLLVQKNKEACEDMQDKTKSTEKEWLLKELSARFDAFNAFGLIDNPNHGFRPYCKRAEAEIAESLPRAA